MQHQVYVFVQGGASPRRCYRDTKMEIQGLSNAQVPHSQHGVLRRTLSSRPGTDTGSARREDETAGAANLCEPLSDSNNNNNRARTSSLVENGCGTALSFVSKQQPAGTGYYSQRCHGELWDVTADKDGELNVSLELNDSTPSRPKLRESETGAQMATPMLEGDKESTSPRQLTLPLPRPQQCKELSLLAASDNTNNTESQSGKDSQDASYSSRLKRKMSESRFKGSAEVGNVLITLCDANKDSNADQSYPVFGLLNERLAEAQHLQTDVCEENTAKPGLLASLSCHAENRSGEIIEVVETSDLGFSRTSGLEDCSSNGILSTNMPSTETFSGSIMINNQDIIVTIENGILTLATPPGGNIHNRDDIVSPKEHLALKDHEDIILLNYNGGTKPLGKMSCLSGSNNNNQPEEVSHAGLPLGNSGLALVDNCPLAELSASFESCPIVKQEAGASCPTLGGNQEATESLKDSDQVADCVQEDFQCPPLIKAKKEALVSFCCPKVDCSFTFDSRQKLKVHLLNHAEDPRPYQCIVEGCEWAFTTSYKLKRHLRSHDKQRPHTCQFEGCGRRFTTVYNLKAHVKVHDQEKAFICEICNERFRSSTRLTNHQRVHFEPQRPHKCEFPGCEKTFITFSALYSHNRTHFKETGQFCCTFPSCDKMYDKACRLKIHMRSHTGERPFVCDSEGCGWSFTCMSKLLRHKRKHDDDRRFVCMEEGCGKSFTRAEHLKGHSITHLGTKPFQCHAEGCNAKFSARSSLYIHSKKHKQDICNLRTRCPVNNCSKHFSTRSSLKNHVLKHHKLSPDALSQIETTPTLTPSNELFSSALTVSGPGIAGPDQINHLDLSSLFSTVPAGTALTTGIGVGIPVGGGSTNGTITMDLSLVSSGILTIDPASVGTTPCSASCATFAKPLDPLILTGAVDVGPHSGLEGTVGDVLPSQATLNLDDVQTVTSEALGTLTALTLQGPTSSSETTLQLPLSSSGPLSVDHPASLAMAPVVELLASPSKTVDVEGQGGAGPLLGCVEVLGPQEGGTVLSQFVCPGHNSNFSPQKDDVTTCSFLESGGSARTDYRAIQLAKKKKQRGLSSPGVSSSSQRTCETPIAGSAVAFLASSASGVYGESATASAGLPIRDPVSATQYVQIQLLQDDAASDGDLAFQLSSQPSSSHSQLTVDLPVNILQDPSVITEDDNGSDTSQFAGSTINLQDLE